MPSDSIYIYPSHQKRVSQRSSGRAGEETGSHISSPKFSRQLDLSSPPLRNNSPGLLRLPLAQETESLPGLLHFPERMRARSSGGLQGLERERSQNWSSGPPSSSSGLASRTFGHERITRSQDTGLLSSQRYSRGSNVLTGPQGHVQDGYPSQQLQQGRDSGHRRGSADLLPTSGSSYPLLNLPDAVGHSVSASHMRSRRSPDHLRQNLPSGVRQIPRERYGSEMYRNHAFSSSSQSDVMMDHGNSTWLHGPRSLSPTDFVEGSRGKHGAIAQEQYVREQNLVQQQLQHLSLKEHQQNLLQLRLQQLQEEQMYAISQYQAEATWGAQQQSWQGSKQGLSQASLKSYSQQQDYTLLQLHLQQQQQHQLLREMHGGLKGVSVNGGWKPVGNEDSRPRLHLATPPNNLYSGKSSDSSPKGVHDFPEKEAEAMEEQYLPRGVYVEGGLWRPFDSVQKKQQQQSFARKQSPVDWSASTIGNDLDLGGINLPSQEDFEAHISAAQLVC